MTIWDDFNAWLGSTDLTGGINGGNRQTTTQAQSDPNQAGTAADARALADLARDDPLAYQRASLAQLYARCPGPNHPVTSPLYAPEPEPPIPDAGFRAGEIVAWRCWRVEQGWLRSMYRDDIWAPKEVVTGKVKEYGVHGWKAQSKALEYAMRDYSNYAAVLGTVDMWGEVIEHEYGYRAEFAAIASVECLANVGFDRRREDEILANIRERYGLTAP